MKVRIGISSGETFEHDVPAEVFAHMDKSLCRFEFWRKATANDRIQGHAMVWEVVSHRQEVAEEKPEQLQRQEGAEATREQLQLRLDPGHLAAIIDSAVVSSCEVVNFHFNALAGANLDQPAHTPEARHTFTHTFKGPELNAAQRRAMHENWILAKAFQELLRAVRDALETAYVFVALLGKTHRVSSSATLVEFLAPFQKKAADLKFPPLLAAVNERLEPKLDFAESYGSLQTVRNCLEHRGGIVSKVDTDGQETFDFSVPRVKIFYMRQGSEVELIAGEKVEPGDDRAEVQIFMRLEVRKRSVSLGERITFTLPEFNEIAFACHFLGTQLATRLPRPMIAKNLN
jgi:hypothetical protein